MKMLMLPHGAVALPAFFPDGTRGVVRCLDSADVSASGTPGLVMNTFHLLSKPGPSTVKALGGLHAFIGWNRPILTDSGGFQVFSLIRENAKFGEIQEKQIVFRGENGKKTILTPEKCIQAQLSYGADILMCLDFCTHPDDPAEVNLRSVETTIRWAERCRREFDLKATKPENRPLLFGIIQGGGDRALRKHCADALIDIGFDGFGFGGWPLDSENRLLDDILEYTASLMPDETPKYAMGLGRPEEILRLTKMGYNLFDCVIPTREARHGRLYVFDEDLGTPEQAILSGGQFYSFYYCSDEVHRRDGRPVSAVCDCHLCKNYSRAYLRHLFVINDPLAYRLATIHNLRFYSMLMEQLQGRQP